MLKLAKIVLILTFVRSARWTRKPTRFLYQMVSTDAPSSEWKYISRIYGARYLDFTGGAFCERSAF